MKQLVDSYRESHLGNRLPAYDGRKSLYTAGPLPFTSKEFRINLLDEEEGAGGQRSSSYGFLVYFLIRNFQNNNIFPILQTRKGVQSRDQASCTC